MKRLMLLVLFVLFSFFLNGCGNKSNVSEEKQSTPVEVSQVSKTKMEINYSTSGQIEASTEVTVAPKVSGRVREVKVKLGDQVKAGQVLFHIEDTVARNDVVTARNDVVKARSGVTQAEASIGVNKTAYDTDTQALEDAQSYYDRYKKLYESNAVSKYDFEQAKTKLVNAQNNLEQAQQQMNEASASLNSAQASLSTAQTSLSTAQETLDDYSVIAPMDGIIGSIDVEVGEMVSSQTNAADIVSIGSVKVKTSIPESVVNKVRVGSNVEVHIDSINKSFKGTLTAVAPKADSTTMGYPAEISIANPAGEIKPGMSAKINLVTGSLTNIIALPVDAVIEQDGQHYVYLVENDKAKKVTVETEITNDTLIEITSGLKEGQSIIVQGNRLLSDGQQVRVVQRQEGGSK